MLYPDSAICMDLPFMLSNKTLLKQDETLLYGLFPANVYISLNVSLSHWSYMQFTRKANKEGNYNYMRIQSWQ